MKKLSVAKFGRIFLAGAAVVVSLMALIPGRTVEAIPQPLCGPTFQWSCVVPGCPLCPEVLFVGTICEKDRFEKETGRVCSPI